MRAGDGGTAKAEPPACSDAHSLAVLELPQLLARVASLARSPLGAERVRRLAPSADLPTVARRQRRLAQLRELLAESPPPVLEGLAEVGPYFPRLMVDGAFLAPDELEVVAVFLASAGSAHSFLAAAQDRFDELARLHNRLTPLPEVVKAIRRIMGPGGSVSSNASPELGRVRRELSRARDRLRSELSSLFNRGDLGGVFSDQVVTQRAGRYVVPVRTDHKGSLKGIIHDTSGSGATCFVEPLDAVEGNNHLALLLRQENEEEEKVLRDMARLLAANLQVLQEDQEALAKLDCLLAQADFCRRLDCTEPVLATTGELELSGVRHPLLAWRALAGRSRAVPIEIHLAPGEQVLVISGANAGGKTATLKTMGLVTLMAQCGLQIPAEGHSRLTVFRQILAEVGDDQDLDRELSTFTAHAGRLAWMVERAGRGSLVLIDEIGGGTDPGEGSALAAAVLDWLVRQGAAVLCTTHFHRLKAYAARTPGVKNVSVAFDQSSGQATYQLHYGTPGFSDALAVSRRLGFPPALLAAAEAGLEAGERQTVALLQEAEEARQAANAAVAEAQRDRHLAREKRQEADRVLKDARRERAGALAEGKRRVREVVKRMEGKLEGVLERFASETEAGRPVKPGQVRQEIYAARREALAEVEARVTPPEPETKPRLTPAPLKAGDRVRLLHLEQEGYLLEDPRPSAETVPVSVGVGGVRVLAPLRELEPLPPAGRGKPGPGPRRVAVSAEAGDGLDLKVVGLTVEEALPLVDKALDQALLSGKQSIAVVHGVGTGRLRAGVREFLKNHPYVAGVHQPEGRRGGAGVTVVELRD
ncbi:MAG: Smr/MutS family protein [Deltaproteobacteria bacterium]|nr:Smr/MutS family protein [Deltaproteobacteria bacterium]